MSCCCWGNKEGEYEILSKKHTRKQNNNQHKNIKSFHIAYKNWNTSILYYFNRTKVKLNLYFKLKWLEYEHTKIEGKNVRQ